MKLIDKTYFGEQFFLVYATFEYNVFFIVGQRLRRVCAVLLILNLAQSLHPPVTKRCSHIHIIYSICALLYSCHVRCKFSQDLLN